MTQRQQPDSVCWRFSLRSSFTSRASRQIATVHTTSCTPIMTTTMASNEYIQLITAPRVQRPHAPALTNAGPPLRSNRGRIVTATPIVSVTLSQI